MNRKQILCGLVALFVTGAGCAQTIQPSFRDTLEQHLRAIPERDLDAYIPTLPSTDGTDLYLIYSSGQLITDREKIIETHREWFEKTNWKFNTEKIREVVTDSMGFVLLRVNYEDQDENRTPFQMELFLNLIFQKIEGKWVLIHDQNTLIKDSRRQAAE